MDCRALSRKSQNASASVASSAARIARPMMAIGSALAELRSPGSCVPFASCVFIKEGILVAKGMSVNGSWAGRKDGSRWLFQVQTFMKS